MHDFVLHSLPPLSVFVDKIIHKKFSFLSFFFLSFFFLFLAFVLFCFCFFVFSAEVAIASTPTQT